ncbi:MULTISPECIES: hypothetical protein [Marichromatium]|uniref:Uncharacterized protein n=1 Tax=Marichromatium gracile TaxID=1048 RepID=A0A4R4A8C4_MARGR|nr:MULTISPECIES: hypothetical protein [Marichromatium]MBO8084799.1 hypothetical protein [Marichromatium sp.]MBK1707996.1 hypothetical protein [Marichromatium gracile]RNE90202.1 hypothetical protein EBL84_08015 [Marichromatium sp. AB31]RNE93491.1 hypothetical protein EBL85_06905 [Marichromatium sp. AB32]TCW35122.1 hypothetical protein EDC29_10761 [Marichromatium gracile]
MTTPNSSDAEHGQNPQTARRRLLKQAAIAAPAILTLRSGAALAQTSGCLDVIERNVKRELNPGEACDGFLTDETNNGVTTTQCNGNIVTASSATSLGPDAPLCE